MRRRCRAASRLRDFKLLIPSDMKAYHGQPRDVQQGVERDARTVGASLSVHAALSRARVRCEPDAFAGQTVAMAAVIVVVAAFVLYPIYYLLQAAFDVGAPNVRPPTAYGFDNFAALGSTGRSCSTR